MKKTIILVIILVSIIAVIFFLFLPQGWKGNLVSPMGLTVISTPDPTSVPPVAPKTFKFDRNTDLNAELEKVNPTVEDADFN